MFHTFHKRASTRNNCAWALKIDFKLKWIGWNDQIMPIWGIYKCKIRITKVPSVFVSEKWKTMWFFCTLQLNFANGRKTKTKKPKNPSEVMSMSSWVKWELNSKEKKNLLFVNWNPLCYTLHWLKLYLYNY